MLRARAAGRRGSRAHALAGPGARRPGAPTPWPAWSARRPGWTPSPLTVTAGGRAWARGARGGRAGAIRNPGELRGSAPGRWGGEGVGCSARPPAGATLRGVGGGLGPGKGGVGRRSRWGTNAWNLEGTWALWVSRNLQPNSDPSGRDTVLSPWSWRPAFSRRLSCPWLTLGKLFKLFCSRLSPSGNER